MIIMILVISLKSVERRINQLQTSVMRIIILLFTLYLLCNCEQSRSKQQDSPPKKLEVTEAVPASRSYSWRKVNSYTHQTDTTFQIDLLQKANELQLRLSFSEDGRFLDEVQKVKDILEDIAIDYNLKQVSSIDVSPVNNKELFTDFLSLKAIQDNIHSNEKKGWRWINFTVISDNVYQSELLKHFTDLFRDYRLEPTEYLLEKCAYHRLEEGNYTMTCPWLRMNFQPVE